MPGPPIPVKSGIHRAACFALYRALFRRSRQVLPLKLAEVFGKHIKDAFRINAKARSRTAICAALGTGYAVSLAIPTYLLQAPDSCRQTLEDLATRRRDILRQLSELSQSSETVPKLKGKRKARPGTTAVLKGQSAQQPTYTGRRWPHPDAKPVLDGLPPLPPGKLRRVPTLVNANHIPFLRFTKPQSPFLSYIIRKKNVERERRVDKMQALEKLVGLAEDEDEWDRILWEHHQVSTHDNGARWISATREALTNVKRVHQINTAKRMHIAQRMFYILQEQERLVDQERLERRNRRHQAYKARRMQRREAASTATQTPSSEQEEDKTPAASAAAT
ncbi:MAG: hypothetical protein LQ338_006868 [Usnochroma carphineum]|nr:MAG: hypothetical protein LQ338_006868 [Usnochroma carphineum]